MTALMWAAMKGVRGMVECLLDAGADIGLTTENRFSVFEVAVLYGHLDVVQCIVDRVEDLNCEDYYTDDDARRTMLIDACILGNDTGSVGATALASVEYLVECGSDVNLIVTETSLAALPEAAGATSNMLRYLVWRGADIQVRGGNGRTALSVAAAKMHLGNVEFLLGLGADVNTFDEYGTTPLIHAAGTDDKDPDLRVIECLLDHGADINAQMNPWIGFCTTALFHAAAQGSLGVVEYLLGMGADMNLSNHQKWTPLLGAAQHGRLDVVEYLVEHGADINARGQYWGGRGDALSVAEEKQHEHVVAYIRARRKKRVAGAPDEGPDISKPRFC